VSARLCTCGAEAIVVEGPTALCVTHARALDPAELYRMERAKRAGAPRCQRCRYALLNGRCPMCDGRRVAERLPMSAPLPAAPDTKSSGRAKVIPIGGRRRSA
jgi:hypothetical protein